MSSSLSSLTALCERLQTSLSENKAADIMSACLQVEKPSTALINERAALLSSAPSADADEAARPVLYCVELLLRCSQLEDLPHAIVVQLFKSLRGTCMTGSFQQYLTAAPTDSYGGQLLFAIVHHLITCSTRCLEQVGRVTVPQLLVSPHSINSAANESSVSKGLRLCRMYLHPLMLLVRTFPTFFHTELAPCVLQCNTVLCEILSLPPSNPHRRLSLRAYFSLTHNLICNSLAVTLASPALHFADKCTILDNLFPAFLLSKDDISAEHAAALLYFLSSLLQSTLSPTSSKHGSTAQRSEESTEGGNAPTKDATPQLPADVVEKLFIRFLPLLMALLPRAHPYAVLRDNLPPPAANQKNQSGTAQYASEEPALSQQLGKLLDHCATAVCNLLTALLTISTPFHSSNAFSSPSSVSSSNAAALLAVRSFLWRHLLSRQPLVSRLIVMVFVHAIPRWGTTFRVQTLQTALHVLRAGDRPMEELWRTEAVEAASDLLSAIFPLLSESEQQMLWGSLGVVDGLTRLAADCDVVIAFDMPPASSRSVVSSQSSSQSLTPTQILSASSLSSSQLTTGSSIPLCLVVRLLCRTHLHALHSSTQALVSQTLVRLLVAYLQSFSGAERMGSVEQLSLLLHTLNLTEWLLVSPLAFSTMLSLAQQRDVMTKEAAALSSLLTVAGPSTFYTAKDLSNDYTKTLIDRLQDCTPLLQQRLLLAVLGLLDTSIVDEFSTAQLLRVSQGVTAIAQRWPSVRWRLPPFLLRVCGSPVLRSTATAPESATSHLVSSIVALWHILLQRPPSTSTSVTDVLYFDSAISRLFDTTARLASTPFKHEAANLLPSHGKDEVLRLLKEWQITTQMPQPHPPTDEQWNVWESQRHIMAVLLPHAEERLNGRAADSVDDVGVKLELEADVGGESRYLLKLGELMRHNVRSREIACMLLQLRSQMSEDEWRQVKATLRDDEAEWIALFNAVNSAV